MTYSAQTAHLIDEEVREIIDEQYEKCYLCLRTRVTLVPGPYTVWGCFTHAVSF